MAKLALLAFIVILATTGIVVAQDLSIVGALPYGAMFVPGGITPVRVDIRNGVDRPIDGTIQLQMLDPTAPEYRTPVHLAPRSRLSTTIWVTLFRAQKKSTIAKVMLHDSSGAEVARSEMAGAPIEEQVSYSTNGVPDSGYVISISNNELISDFETLEQLKEAYANSLDMKAAVVEMEPSDAPRSPAGYRSAVAAQLRNIDLNLLDVAQQLALRDYIASGGVLLINAPRPQLVNGTWLEELLPVRLVGQRELKEIKRVGRPAMPLLSWMPCAEAIAGEGTIVAQDEQYVHAAYRPYGLGRVVFTSFPASGMSAKVAGDMWKELLGTNRAPAGVAGSGIARQFGQLMEPMLGRPAASWTIAAIASIGMAGLVLVSHLIWRGAARPRGFALTLASGIAVAAGFGAMAMVRQKDPLQEARLSVIDASPAGSLVCEYAAAAGPQREIGRKALDDRATLTQALRRGERATISYWPGKAERIEVSPQQVELVTLTSNFDRQSRGRALGQFTRDGLALSLENNLPSALKSAQLSWGRYRMAIGSVPQGNAQAVAGYADLRPDDEFTARSGLASQDELHKGQILRALLRGSEAESRNRGTWPTVVGWADSYPPITTMDGAQPDRSAAQNLVRIPVTIKPSDPGQSVRIDGVFNKYVIGQARGLPFDPQLNVFLQSSLTGRWLFGIRPPAEAGKLRPEKARVRIELATPQHQIILHGGQAIGGKQPTSEKPAGRVLESWNREVGARSFEFDCGKDDVDEQGTLWFLIEVKKSADAGTLGIEPQWRFAQLLVDLEGKVQ